MNPSSALTGKVTLVTGASSCIGRTAGSPRLRYPVGKGVLLSRLRRLAPVGVFDRAIRKESALN
jgi:hypothetical protein